eukprot:g10259.t1
MTTILEIVQLDNGWKGIQTNRSSVGTGGAWGTLSRREVRSAEPGIVGACNANGAATSAATVNVGEWGVGTGYSVAGAMRLLELAAVVEWCGSGRAPGGGNERLRASETIGLIFHMEETGRLNLLSAGGF